MVLPPPVSTISGFQSAPVTFQPIVSSCLIHRIRLVELKHFRAVYSLDDTSGDTSFNDFNINAVPSYVFSVLNDIISVNDNVKVHPPPLVPGELFMLLLGRTSLIARGIAWVDEGQWNYEWRVFTIAILTNTVRLIVSFLSHISFLRATLDPTYFLKAVQGYSSQLNGFPIYAISIQVGN